MLLPHTQSLCPASKTPEIFNMQAESNSQHMAPVFTQAQPGTRAEKGQSFQEQRPTSVSRLPLELKLHTGPPKTCAILCQSMHSKVCMCVCVRVRKCEDGIFCLHLSSKAQMFVCVIVVFLALTRRQGTMIQ